MKNVEQTVLRELLPMVDCLMSDRRISENMFMLFYPCVLAGIIPVSLLGYDERSKWDKYSLALPYTRAQIVSSKYLMGLFIQLTVLVFAGVTQIFYMKNNGGFNGQSFLVLFSTLSALSFFTSSISLPLMFKWGVEKGRMVYYIMIGLACGSSVLVADMFTENIIPTDTATITFPILTLISIAVFALSWYLSIVFFRKREF